VPSVPDYVRGVVNVRGRVVPVVDLAARFGFGETALSKWTCIVLVDTGAGAKVGVVGLLADRVSDVVELADADLQAPPAFGTRARRDFLRAVGRAQDRFVLLLEVARVLGDDVSEVSLAATEGGEGGKGAEEATGDGEVAEAAEAARAAEATEAPEGAAGRHGG